MLKYLTLKLVQMNLISHPSVQKKKSNFKNLEQSSYTIFMSNLCVDSASNSVHFSQEGRHKWTFPWTNSSNNSHKGARLKAEIDVT